MPRSCTPFTGPELRRRVPGIVALERAIEIENVDEVVLGIRRLADQETELDECEHDITDVTGTANAPVFQHDARHYTVTFEREPATRIGELRPRDVPAFRQLRL
jgi:hypothetical protein